MMCAVSLLPLEPPLCAFDSAFNPGGDHGLRLRKTTPRAKNCFGLLADVRTMRHCLEESLEDA